MSHQHRKKQFSQGQNQENDKLFRQKLSHPFGITLLSTVKQMKFLKSLQFEYRDDILLLYFYPYCLINNNNILMSIQYFTVLSLLLLIHSQPNYQERNVYYSETDNSCRYGDFGDKINLIINLDDQERIKREIDGGTWCNPSPFIPTRYASCIITSERAYLLEDNTDVRLNQVATKKYTFGLLSQLIIRSTTSNFSKINNKEYNCTIFGDGTIQHFGTYLATDPAEIYMRCLSVQEKKSEVVQSNNLIANELQQ